MRHDVRTSGKRPREAYTEMMTSVPNRFKSSGEQVAVISNLRPYNEVRNSLMRHRVVQCIPIPDQFNIPEELRQTLRGRQLEEDDINKGESFLLHSGQEGNCFLLTYFGIVFAFQWYGYSQRCRLSAYLSVCNAIALYRCFEHLFHRACVESGGILFL